MRFTFDPAKQSSSIKKHGYDLADVQKLIESRRTLTFEDNRFDYGEARFVTMGLLSDVVVVIVTTETESEIRVISMRKADKHEQKIYFEHS